MSAEDHLGPQWVIRRGDGLGKTQLRAYHPKTGKHVGSLNWLPGVGDRPAEVYKAVTHEDFRRQGVGRALWNAARNIEPGLQHSHALTADGEKFAAGTPTSDPITPVEIKPQKGNRPW